MLSLSCLCGQVRLETDRLPDFINACNCTLCSKSGAYWGYFQPDEVRVTGETSGFRRTDKGDPAVTMHFCGACGATTHFRLTDNMVARFGGDRMMGVNMRLADEAALAGIELRFPDGRAWAGEGEFGYVREAIVIGEGAAG